MEFGKPLFNHSKEIVGVALINLQLSTSHPFDE